MNATSVTRANSPDHDQQGSVSLFFVVAVLGMFAALGLVVEGAARVQAIQVADNAAAEAARAAGQQLDAAAVAGGVSTRLDAAAAARAAQGYLAAAGVSGTTSLTYPNGSPVVVVTTTVTPESPLAGFGLLAPSPVTGSASVRLAQGVSGEEAP